MLTFNESDHTYELDGKPIPSVTTILKDVGLYSFYEGPDSEFYKDRGTKGHKAIHLLDKGTLDIHSLDPQLLPYVQAYRNFKDEHSVEVISSEIMVCDRNYWFAGTLDKLVEMDWKGERIKPLIDVKLGAPIPGYALQTGGYSYAIGDHLVRPRFSLHLKDDETFKLKPHVNDEDFGVFLSAVNVYHAKHKNGGKKWTHRLQKWKF